MERVKLFFSVLGVLLGVTGAYATRRHAVPQYGNIIYNWYIANGQLAFSATIEVAKSACIQGDAVVCLRGTATIIQQPSVTLLRR